jgi:hypothetical protein
MDQKSRSEMSGDPDRRVRERRKDVAQFRFISRVLGMRRAFGTETAKSLLRRMGRGRCAGAANPGVQWRTAPAAAPVLRPAGQAKNLAAREAPARKPTLYSA